MGRDGETSKARGRLIQFCRGSGLDIGFGGDPIAPWAICMDQEKPYTNVGPHPQHIFGDCRSLPFMDNTLDFIYSSHLIEDFFWGEIQAIISEWTRVIKPSGMLVNYGPDQEEYVRHCGRIGTRPNEHHKEADFGLRSFKEIGLKNLRHKVVFEFNEPDEGTGYSFGIAVMVIK